MSYFGDKKVFRKFLRMRKSLFKFYNKCFLKKKILKIDVKLNKRKKEGLAY